MKRNYCVLLLLLAALLLAACGGRVPEGNAGEPGNTGPRGMEETASPAEAPSPTGSTVPAEETQAPEEPPTPTAGPAESEQSEEDAPIEALVRSFVSEESGVPEEEIGIVTREEVEWPNSALGCPQPGMMYSDVIIPGYRFTVSVAGETLTVHTDERGGNIIICTNEETGMEQNNSGNAGQGDGDQPENLVPDALALLARESGLSESDFSVQRVERVLWRDSSLGCPQPDMMYMQVLTPGYRLLFEGNGETFYVHSDLMGETLILCEDPQEPAEPIE